MGSRSNGSPGQDITNGVQCRSMRDITLAKQSMAGHTRYMAETECAVQLQDHGIQPHNSMKIETQINKLKVVFDTLAFNYLDTE